MQELVTCVLFSYLIGSIPTGYIFGKLIKHIDLRKHGSGNLGATNVFRTLGAKWGIITLLLDIIKGVVCVVFISKLCSTEVLSIEAVKVLCGVGAIIGHVYTVFLGFKGGKGVATSAGVFFSLNWPATLVALLVFVIMLAIFKYVSLGSICAAVTLPIAMNFFSDVKVYLVLSMVVSALVVIKHKSNVRRLVLGEEKKIWTSKK